MKAETRPDFVAPVTMAKGRLDQVVRLVAGAYRRAHLTADEVRYVHKRARQLAWIGGQPERVKQLPDVPTPAELERILAGAYRARPRHGLIVRTLFETGLRASELVGLDVGDVDFTERSTSSSCCSATRIHERRRSTRACRSRPRAWSTTARCRPLRRRPRAPALGQ